MDPKHIIDEIIVPFVGGYDVPFKYDRGVGELLKQGCFDAVDASATLDELACFVGASYCAVIREDVHLRIPEGLQLVRRSASAFDQLLQCSKSTRRRDIRYILTRWQDAKGRILYRSGNHALARLAFNDALQLTEGLSRPAWRSSCWPDIVSNSARNDFEIDSQAGAIEMKRKSALLRRLDRAVRAAEAGVAKASDKFIKREVERGLLSALHNWLTINKSASTQADAYQARLKELFVGPCRRDVYRRAQYVNMLGQLAEDTRKKTEHYEKLWGMAWRRGKFFADQQLANLRRDWQKLLKLCEEIDDDIGSSGGVDAVDIQRYDFTLTLAEACAPPEDRDAQTKLRMQGEAITRALSAIVSIATYRQRFESKIRPRLRRMVRDDFEAWKSGAGNSKVVREQFDQLVDRLEEFAAKEVVEILRTNRHANARRGNVPANVDRFVIKGRKRVRRRKDGPATAVVATACRSEEATLSIATRADRLMAVEEQHWLDHPLTIRAPLTSPSEWARQYTRANAKTLIVRYSFMGVDKVQIAAFWWYGGRSGAATLSADSLKLVDTLSTSDEESVGDLFIQVDNEKVARMPKVKISRELWDRFLQPVMAEIGDETVVRHLTIILDAGLYHIPLNFAWVPANSCWFSACDRPLALACATTFSLNLNAHLAEGRSTLNHCQKDGSDDLWILENDLVSSESPLMTRLSEAVRHWGERGRLKRSASRRDLQEMFSGRPEFVMFACHGETDRRNGPSLLLSDCDLLSANIAYSVAMKGNKLLILGACDSATADSDSYGRFIGAFIAAGAGAVLANPCKALISNVCNVASHLLTFGAGREPNTPISSLDERLVAAANFSLENLGMQDQQEEERKLMASSYQLWL